MADVCGAMTPDEAALEFSRVVLQMAPPYASLFLDEEAMLNGVHAERAERSYREAGFAIAPEWRAGPADHLGLELLFLGHLLERDREIAAGFLSEYLLPWAPVCLLAIGRIRAAPLYSRLASITLEVLQGLE